MDRAESWLPRPLLVVNLCGEYLCANELAGDLYAHALSAHHGVGSWFGVERGRGSRLMMRKR